MKYFGMTSFILFTLFIVSTGYIACEDSTDIDDTNSTLVLTEQEQSDLLFMREEEKLARDVYIYFDELYSINIFGNISSSEQTHMDAVLVLIEKYGLEDPASKEIGIFNNKALQELYDDLISQGKKSLEDALRVGATIEDVDIRDLDEAIAGTNKSDIIEMYERLNCGSRNHMRAFSGQLESRDEAYSPQFISVEQYNEIINGAHEHCGR